MNVVDPSFKSELLEIEKVITKFVVQYLPLYRLTLIIETIKHLTILLK